MVFATAATWLTLEPILPSWPQLGLFDWRPADPAWATLAQGEDSQISADRLTGTLGALGEARRFLRQQPHGDRVGALSSL